VPQTRVRDQQLSCDGPMTSDNTASALALLRKQYSHVLFVLSNAKQGHEARFLDWYRSHYRETVSVFEGVLASTQYELHEVDITQGRYPRLPFRYLGLHELSLDGAVAAEGLIERIALLHREHGAAEAPATWLYYPVSEKVGRASRPKPSMLTLAFANGLAGQEAEFREWYATRHIRHALNVPALVTGQCFQRTQYQKPGALGAEFEIIAVYEQEGTPEDILQSFASLPESIFHFPTLDTSRFAEAVYRLV
jgi:hypothetical protein